MFLIPKNLIQIRKNQVKRFLNHKKFEKIHNLWIFIFFSLKHFGTFRKKI